jgi:LysM repeat protein
VTTGGDSTPAGSTTYKIQKGDMLITIAQKYHTTAKALQAANPGLDPNRMQVDHTITIPAATASATPATGGTPTPVVATADSPKPGVSYKVKKGDTLVSISREAYGNAKNVDKIFQANRTTLKDPNTVSIGAVIKIPA